LSYTQSEKLSLGVALDESRAEAKDLQEKLREAGAREAALAADLAASRQSLEDARATNDDTAKREAVALAKVKELNASLQSTQVRRFTYALSCVTLAHQSNSIILVGAQASLAAAEYSATSAGADLAMARSEVVAAQRSLAAASMERDKLAIQLEGAAEDALRLQSSVDKLRAERSELTRQLEAAAAAAAEAAQQRRREQSAEATQRAELAAVRAELAAAQEALSVATAAVAAAQVGPPGVRVAGVTVLLIFHITQILSPFISQLTAAAAQEEARQSRSEALEGANASAREEAAELQSQVRLYMAHVLLAYIPYIASLLYISCS
jgi:chromosome segregation ATPase